MLVLSRKPGEKILIGEEVVVTIVRIGPNTVRIGIDAPKSMNIVRQELDVTVTGEEWQREGVNIVSEELSPTAGKQ